MGDAQCTTAASKTSGTINIRFLVDDTNVAFDGETAISETPTYSSHNQTNFIIHPAFTFGSGTNLTGIWVSKFHASTPITHACYTTENATNCNVSTITPNFVPNVKSWRYAQISNIFTATRNMETNNRYGWGTTGSGIDTHLMKNIEWGATLYLAQSAYGKNAAIWNNPSSTYVAGCAGGTISTSAIEGCPYQFYTSNGQQASTTGNIYGIYDMLSNDGEFVAGCINNTYADDYGASLYNADNKYKDLYNPGLNSDETYINIESKKGDAVYETGNGSYYGEIWYGGDSSFLPDDAFPWFLRGHNNNTPFIFSGISGEVEAYRSFHTVLLVGTGL
jgi:hypothetical protein